MFESRKQKLDDDQKKHLVKMQEFEKEKQLIAEVNPCSDDILKLDIGGEQIVKVSRSVLTRVKGSSLEAMFSGRHTLKKDNDAVFLDRDADVFSMVISYLRNGLSYPTVEEKVLRERFEKEIDFWMLEGPKKK